MVLSTENTGKYFTRRWNDMRNRAVEDRTQFSTEELEWLEITGSEGMGALNPERMMVENRGIDPRGKRFGMRDVDIREIDGR